MVTSQRRTHGKIRGRHASRGVPPTNRYDSGSLARRTGATTWAQLFRYTVFDRDTIRAAYDEPYVYTMGRPGFILQQVVDAFAVQAANCDSSPIGVVFGLVGLYLHVEKQFSGHQVQQVHIKLGVENESGRVSISPSIGAA